MEALTNIARVYAAVDPAGSRVSELGDVAAKAGAEPFFARLLESQQRPTGAMTMKAPSDKDELPFVGSAAYGPVTLKWPSDSDEAVTLKWPSDDDEEVYRAAPQEERDGPGFVTMKYPSDADEVLI